MSKQQYWLLKSEPDAFSIDDLFKAKNQTAPWDGVRNYQARNFLRKMLPGDLAFFYHSSCAVPAIVGLMEIVSASVPEPSDPRWVMVDVKFKQKYTHPITLAEIKANTKLRDLILARKGNRLSVMPISAPNFKLLLAMQH
jgi:predicted RNA-binding protein with PUA-like domain